VSVIGSSTEKGGGNYGVNGFVNVPFGGDRFAFRVVGWHEDNSGYIDQLRLGLKDVNDEQTSGGRLMLSWKVSDALTLSAMGMYQKQEIGGGSRFNPVGTIAQQFPDYIGPDLVVERELQNTDFTQNFRTDEATVLSVKADLKLDFGQIVAVSNLYDREFLNNFDSTPILLFFGVPIAAISSFPEDRSVQSNEIRFSSAFDSRFQMVTGVLYQKEEIDSSSDVLSVDERGLVSVPSPDILSVLREREFDETAVFGEFTWNFTDRLAATFGARYADFEFVTDENAIVPFFGPPTGPEPTKRGDESATTVKFNLSYTLNDDAMVYATASQGYRRGGLNLNAFGDLFDIPETFGSDELWNYEVGVKTAWFDQRLLLNATVYSLRWEDIQVETVNAEGTAEFFTNAGKAQVDGLELELFARPIPGWDLSAAVGYTDARLTEDQPPLSGGPDDPVLGRDGDRINNVPEWTFALSSEYRWPLLAGFDALVRADFSYTGSSNTQVSPRNPSNVRLESYELVNAQVGVANDNWRAVVFVQNAFDERPQNDAINDLTNILAYVTSRPRTIGVRVDYQF
jgi:outer membrane receptor protein involved in Fe transport